MGCEVKDIRKRWQAAQATPLKPVVVDYGTVQDEVHMGDNLLEHGGLEEFPIPNSTPGFDVGPYTTASNWVTKDAGNRLDQCRQLSRPGERPDQDGRLHRPAQTRLEALGPWCASAATNMSRPRS